MAQLIKFIASFGYLGYSPFASGSVASVAGALMCYFFAGQTCVYIGVFLIVTALGFMVSGPMEKIEGKKDPSAVVIDEVAGSFIAFFMLPLSFSVFITAFFLFRAFDMFKIYPADKLESLGGSYGIMMDDLVAGLYTNIIMQAALRLTGAA